MARRTIGFSEVSARRGYAEEEGPVPLDAIGTNGFLSLLTDWAAQGKNITDQKAKIHTEVDRHVLYSHALLMEVSTGSWGDENRRLVNAKGNVPSREIDRDDASTVGTRVLVIVPPGGDVALYFSEREGHSVGGSRIWKAIQEEIRAAPKVEDANFTPRTLVPIRNTVTLGEAWFDDAHLRAISVTRVRPGSTWASETDDETYTVTQKLTPMGHGHFSNRILTRIREASDRNEVASIVRLEGVEDIESVQITLSDGERESTFEYDSPGTPALREVLNDHGKPALSDVEFVDRCGALAQAYYPRVGRTFDYAWIQ